MGKKSRRALRVVGVVLAVVVVAIVTFFIKVNPTGIGVGRGVQRAGTCRECHPQQYKEWYDGQIAAFAAISAPFMKGQAEEFARWSCWKCHDPFKLGLDEGVTCEYCHGKTGDLETHAEQCAGRRARLDVVRGARFCHNCHSVVHPITGTDFQGTVGEWEASEPRRDGVACQDCHMPLVGEGEDRHHFHGHYYPGRNPLPDRIAVSIKHVSLEEGQISVVVKNHVHGHYLPTGAFTKAMVLEVHGFDEGGTTPVYAEESLFVKRFKFRNVLRLQKFPWKVIMDTRLKPGEEREVTFDVDESIEIARVTASIRFAFVGDEGLELKFYTSESIARKEVVF
jgi:hypothetical protein